MSLKVKTNIIPTYIECNNLLNTEIDDACLTELGKAFHRVMTLGTNDENMYCVRANGLLKLVCWLVLYGKLRRSQRRQI